MGDPVDGGVHPGAAGDEPRDALARELKRLPESAAKRTRSQWWTALIRADRVANQIDLRVRKAMEAR